MGHKTNPDRHGNEWVDGGVYLVEIAHRPGNPTHLACVEARVVTRGGWGSAMGDKLNRWGETKLEVWNPSYDQGRANERRNPNSFEWLRIIRKLDFTFQDKGPSDGKTPWQIRETPDGD